MGNEIFEKFNGMNDEQFLELLIRADKEPVIDGVTMPGFPDLGFQKDSVGSRGAGDLKLEPFRFISAIKSYAEQLGVAINKDSKILDFGVGWGRMIRFFFKDLPSDNIFGVDTWQLMIDKCNQLLPAGNYVVNAPHPPIDFDDNTFDIIFAYSVFSHLRADVAETWIQEFSRILKPNGIIVATTEGTHFLNVCDKLQKEPELTKDNYWFCLISEAFNPIEEFRKRYSEGEFLYVPTGGGDSLDSSFYGDAVIPEKYIKDVFGKHLIFKDFSEDKNLPQAVFVLQKPL